MLTASKLEIQIETALRKLHIDGTLKGYYYLVYAISRTAKNPGGTELITKGIYPDIAAAFKTTASSVERDMRFAVKLCWHCAREALDQMAGYHLTERPTNKQFIDLVAFYIRTQ